MIKWIKNYIDKKVEEKFTDEINKRVNKQVEKSIPIVIETLVMQVFQDLKHQDTQFYMNSCDSTTVHKAKKAFEREVYYTFKKHLEYIKGEYEGLYDLKKDIESIVYRKANKEEFIQKIIDNINKKQLNK